MWPPRSKAVPSYAPIIERYKDTLFGVAMGRLGHVHDAEDITQGVLVEAWERLADLRDPERLGPWLRSIAVHRCIDLVRRNGRRAEHTQAGAIENPDAPATEPDAATEQAEARRQVLAAVATLSTTQRETVTLYYLNGYRLEEVARILKCRRAQRLLTMVEDVLKQDSPKQDFAERVFQLLNLHDGEGRRRWADRHAMKLELSRIADEGLDGFFRALELPHARSRSFAMGMIGASKVQITEELIAMIKRCLKDSNKKVRRHEEFVPLVSALLFGRSRIVRRFAATPWSLGEAIYHYPLERVIAARARRQMSSTAGCWTRWYR